MKTVSDSEVIRRVVHIFILGSCGCHRDGQLPSIKGHTLGCQVRESRADLKRLLSLADKLERKHPVSKKQYIQARCWDC